MGQLLEHENEVEVEAQYTLESPVRCQQCDAMIETVDVVRLLRTKVNFTSSLARRGYAVVCSSCRSFLSATIG